MATSAAATGPCSSTRSFWPVLAGQWLADHLHGLSAPDGWPLLGRTEKSDVFCTQEHSLTQALLDAVYPPYARKKD